VKKKITCETGLEKGIIGKEVFDREIGLCRELNKENGGKCGWGSCDKCGAIPLLYKLHKGVLLEEEELNEIRKSVFGEN